VPEAKKDVNEILSADNLVMEKGVFVPNFSLNNGEVLWMEMENPNWAKLLLPFFNGLIYPRSGSLSVSNKNFNEIKHKEDLISCIYLNQYQAGSVSLNSLVHWIAGSKGTNAAQVWANCKRILALIGSEYVCQVSLNKMAANTLKKVSTAIALSIPKLIIILNDPFLGLEEEAKQYISKEIDTLSKDGSSFVILSQETPSCRVDKNIFLGAVI
jgi:ABC-type multidrug transport system ATPase subunit